MASEVVDDVVVGAGVVGLTTALLLARGGHRVVVVTAEPVGGGASGRSAGVVSQLHGTAYRRLAAETARKNAAAYRAMNAAGFALLEELLAATGTDHERHDAWLVASRPDGTARVDDEHLAAARAGLRLEKLQRSPELPFEHHGALRLRDQILVDPARLLSALAIAATEAGVRIVERQRVVDVRVRPKGVSVVETGQDEYPALHVVLATGTPILDRGLYALKTAAFRMVAVTGTTDAALPIVTAIGPDGSTTTSPTADGRVTAVGQAHAVGTGGSELHRADRVEEALRRLAPDFNRTDAWSGQDYRPFNPIAFVGLLPRGGGAVSFASGFDGWGLTQGAAAGIRLSRDLLGLHRPDWATTIGRRFTRPRSQTVGLAADVRAASALVSGYRRLAPTDLPLLREGQGVVHRTDDGLVATSLTGDVLRSVTATCTRAGGVVVWNDLETSWDCPVCGSRFDVDGSVLEGGARGPLRAVDTPGAPRASSGA